MTSSMKRRSPYSHPFSVLAALFASQSCFFLSLWLFQLPLLSLFSQINYIRFVLRRLRSCADKALQSLWRPHNLICGNLLKLLGAASAFTRHFVWSRHRNVSESHPPCRREWAYASKGLSCDGMVDTLNHLLIYCSLFIVICSLNKFSDRTLVTFQMLLGWLRGSVSCESSPSWHKLHNSETCWETDRKWDVVSVHFLGYEIRFLLVCWSLNQDSMKTKFHSYYAVKKVLK